MTKGRAFKKGYQTAYEQRLRDEKAKQRLPQIGIKYKEPTIQILPSGDFCYVGASYKLPNGTKIEEVSNTFGLTHSSFEKQ
jgi:hypothetical protein